MAKHSRAPLAIDAGCHDRVARLNIIATQKRRRPARSGWYWLGLFTLSCAVMVAASEAALDWILAW